MLVTRPIAADLDFLDLHRLGPARSPILLESAGHRTAQRRCDLRRATGGEASSRQAAASLHGGDGSAARPDFLGALDARWDALRGRRDEPRWQFRDGWPLCL